MISDEERRRVAKALREPSNPLDIHASLYAAFDTCAEAVFTTVPSDFYRHNNRRLLNRLANLIDRETCRNVYNGNEMGACDNGFECSVCGNRVEDYEHYAVTGEFNYCSECGRVVER